MNLLVGFHHLQAFLVADMIAIPQFSGHCSFDYPTLQ